jgi:hypothetical protein
MTRVRSLDTKKLDHFEKTLLRNIPKCIVRAARPVSFPLRPTSRFARCTIGIERADEGACVQNVTYVTAFNTKALLANFKKPFARCCVARVARRQTWRSGFEYCPLGE